MSNFRISADSVLVGDSWLSNVTLVVKDGLITAIELIKHPQAKHVSGRLLPGLIDLQVNGGGGRLLNATPTVDTIATMVSAHRQYGTTSMLPTLITDQLSVIEATACAVAESIDAGIPEVLGVHFEGPHLSQKKKGVHPEQHIRAVSDAELAIFTRKDLGIVKVTLAPENVTPDVIRDLVGQGVLVVLGHSNASYEQVHEALESGAKGFTHLYNAMSPLQSREPGMVGAALTDSRSYAGLVLDHHHVHPVASQLAIKAKGVDKVFLVTDAMAHVGASEDSLPYFDTVINRENGKLTTPDGTLAGSCLDMWQAVKNAHVDLHVPLEDAVKMASLTPATLLGEQKLYGQIAVGAKANFLLVDEALNISNVWVNGTEQYAVGGEQ